MRQWKKNLARGCSFRWSDQEGPLGGISEQRGEVTEQGESVATKGDLGEGSAEPGS